jgi:hypothetical protein
MIRTRLIAVIMILASAGTALIAEVKMPGIALSLSRENYVTELQNAAANNSRVREMVLPEVEFKPGDPLDFTVCREIIKTIGSVSLPTDRVWLHLKLVQPKTGMLAADIEQAVARLVDNLAVQLNFNCFGVILEADAGCSNELVRLAVSSISTSMKAAREDMPIAVSGKIAAKMGNQIPAYVDRVLLNGRDEWGPVLQQLTQMPNDRPFSLLLPDVAGADSRRDYLDAFFAFSQATWDTFIIKDPQPGSIEALLKMVEGLRRHFSGNLVKIENASSFFKLSDASNMQIEQMTFVDVSMNRAVILAKLYGSLAEPHQLSLVIPEGENFHLTCYNPLTLGDSFGQTVASARWQWQEEYILLVAEKSQLRDDSVSESVAVSAKAGLSLEEIMARWQRYDSRQKKMIKNYLANAEMDMHFEPPSVGTSFDISLHFQYFWNVDGIQYWEQTAQFLNGIKLPGKSSFPLPQLEPEQVVAQPLELKLVESYAYHLEKNETIDGRECYVLSFRPRQETKEALYSGKIWIDCSTFRKVQVSLVQNNCSGSILSNLELQHFELVAGPNGAQFNLLRKSEVEQKVLAAGREFMLERRYRFNDIAINADNFNERLQQSVQGSKPMFAETKEGLREYKIAKDGTRQVKGKVETVISSLVGGVLYDDTASFPIPFVGISAINYDFLKTRSQLSALLIVPILALNLSKQYKNNFTLGSDLALSVLPRNDRIYRDSADVKEEAAYIFSGSFGLRANWHPISDLSLSTSSYLVYELFLPQKDTADDFVLPCNGFTLNPNLDLDYSRSGYQLKLSGSFYQRLGWRSWGRPDREEELQKNFFKYNAILGKRFYIGSFTRIGAEISYFSGLHLDRFSSYQPSLLSVPKIRGVGSSAISLDRVGVLSLNLGFTVFDFVRFDTYYNFARGHECQASSSLDFQGAELDFGTIGPWTSYIQGRITYALAGPLERYESRWGVYLMIFIPFKK